MYTNTAHVADSLQMAQSSGGTNKKKKRKRRNARKLKKKKPGEQRFDGLSNPAMRIFLCGLLKGEQKLARS